MCHKSELNGRCWFRLSRVQSTRWSTILPPHSFSYDQWLQSTEKNHVLHSSVWQKKQKQNKNSKNYWLYFAIKVFLVFVIIVVGLSKVPSKNCWPRWTLCWMRTRQIGYAMLRKLFKLKSFSTLIVFLLFSFISNWPEHQDMVAFQYQLCPRLCMETIALIERCVSNSRTIKWRYDRFLSNRDELPI